MTERVYWSVKNPYGIGNYICVVLHVSKMPYGIVFSGRTKEIQTIIIVNNKLDKKQKGVHPCVKIPVDNYKENPMSIMAAIETPIRSAGIPSVHTSPTIDIDDEFVVAKSYTCSKGHNFELTFSSPYNLPVFWECEEHEIIAFEN